MNTSLPTTRLGWTGMRLTRVGFGARAIGGGWAYAWGNQDDGGPLQAALPGTGLASCGHAATADQDVVHDPRAVLAAGQPERRRHLARKVIIPLTGTSNRGSRALSVEGHPSCRDTFRGPMLLPPAKRTACSFPPRRRRLCPIRSKTWCSSTAASSTPRGWRPVYDLLTSDGYHVAVVQNPTLSLQGDAAW